MKQDVLEPSSVIVWRITEKDIAEANLLFPGAVRFSAADTAFPATQRVVEIGGEPLSAVGAALLRNEKLTVPQQNEASISVVLAADDRDRETLENGGLNVPCLVVRLGVVAEPQVVWPEKGADLTFALVEEDPTVVRMVYDAFIKAFEPADPVTLILCSVDVSHHAVLLEITSEAARPNAVVCAVGALRQNGGGGPLQCDLLLFDAARNRHSPILIAAAERGRAVPVYLDASGPTDGSAIERAAAYMRSVARSFFASGSFRASELAGRQELEDRLDTASWGAKARLLRQVAMCQFPEPSRLNGSGWVTRWNVKCGIGDHAAHQVEAAGGRNVILAPHEHPLLAPDKDNVLRCWRMDHLDDSGYGELLDAIYREQLAAIIFHFNWGFYNPAALERLVVDLRAAGRIVVIDLHSTVPPNPQLRLRDLVGCLRLFHRVLVHQQSDLERVRAVAPDAKIMIEPLAVSAGPERVADRSQSPLIGCFGFCLPNKGIEQLVTAFAMLRQSNADVRLLLLNAEHPAPQSAETIATIRGLITTLGLSNAVEFVTDYLEESECLERMSKMTLIVNPYQHTSESASASARYALASGTPVLVTPLPIFDDLGSAVFRASGTSPQQLCDSIRVVLLELQQDSAKAVAIASAARQWQDRHDISKQTHRLKSLMAVIGRNQRLHNWTRFGAIG